MVLPSIHASNGSRKYQISNAHESKPTQGGKGKYTVADIGKLVQPTVPESISDMDDDCPMVDIQDENDAQNVSRMLSNKRSDISNEDDMPISNEDLDSRIPVLMPTRMRSLFVVDTNFFISHLGMLESLRRLRQSFHHQIVVPNTVIRELDGLKSSTKEVRVSQDTEVIGKLARQANDWVYKNLASMDSGVMGQKIRQAINPDCVKDDAILDCCLYFKEKMQCFVVLLSNDKNLCMKALTEGLPTVTFKKGMTAELIASMTYNENLSIFGPGAPDTSDETMDDAHAPAAADFGQTAARVYDEITAALRESIMHIMCHEYGEDINLIGVDSASLTDMPAIIHCFEKFWISVFAEYFKKSTIKKEDWKDFPSCLSRPPSNSADLKNFVIFWGEILTYLYVKRPEEENERIEHAIQHWSNLGATGFHN